MSMETLKEDLKRIVRKVNETKYVEARTLAKDNILPFLENMLEEISEQFILHSEAIAMVEGDTTVIQEEEGERLARHLIVCKEVHDTLPDGPLKSALLGSMQDVAMLLEECVVISEEEEEEEEEEDTEDGTADVQDAETVEETEEEGE